MSFDKDSNTITLDENSDFLVDSGVAFIHLLKETAFGNDVPIGQSKDWEVIENWLGCRGKNISSIEEEKIGKGWKAYLAIGIAPSFNLQEAFDFYSETYKKSGYSYKKDKPPKEVIEVFERMLASDDEIKVKKEHDWTEIKRKLEEFFEKNYPKKKLTFKQKISTLKKNTRTCIIASVFWFIWVLFRTSNDWEILGIYLDDWDEDMFIINVVLPIIIVWLAFKAYKWVTNAKK